MNENIESNTERDSVEAAFDIDMAVTSVIGKSILVGAVVSSVALGVDVLDGGIEDPIMNIGLGFCATGIGIVSGMHWIERHIQQTEPR